VPPLRGRHALRGKEVKKEERLYGSIRLKKRENVTRKT